MDSGTHPQEPPVAPPLDEVAGPLAREEEEALARHYSVPTKILAWLMIAGGIASHFNIAGRAPAELGGIIAIILGFSVKKGSQDYLRIALLLIHGALLVSTAHLAWISFEGRPLVVGLHFYSRQDPEFWATGVGPKVYLLAECILGITALRTRRLKPWEWTKTTRTAIICIAIPGLLFTTPSIIRWQRQKALEETMATEIAAARVFIREGKPTAPPTPALVFDPLTRIVEVRWRGKSGSVHQIYQRVSSKWTKTVYSTWMKNAAGDTGLLEIRLRKDEER